MKATIDPGRYDAVLFDLDGVITDTASVHQRAWKRLFDEFLASRGTREGEDHAEFTADDYIQYVDGKPRTEGVEAFLASRGITLPSGSSSDDPDAQTVQALSARKNGYFLASLEQDGVDAFPRTVELIRSLRAAGLATGVFSSSRNCAGVLQAAGISDLFDTRVDGQVAAELGLPGKPDPATLLEAAGRVAAAPPRAVIVEDAAVGVAAGRSGGFGLVIGVDRTGIAPMLRSEGADVVVANLGEVGVGPRPQRRLSEVPDLDSGLAEHLDTVRNGRLAIFLDFDGTLSPIVPRPDDAAPAPGAREALQRLSRRCPVAIISGRDLADVRRRVDVEGIWYAGSHGFDLAGPDGQAHEYEKAHGAAASLDEAERELRELIEPIPGAIVERKKYSVTSHYRMVAPERAPEVVAAVAQVAGRHPDLRATKARMAGELVPDLEWDKGYALHWLLDQVSPPQGRLTPMYAGDDLTDEDALAAIADIGLGVVVRSAEHGDRPTAAHLAVDSPEQLCSLLQRIAEVVESEEA